MKVRALAVWLGLLLIPASAVSSAEELDRAKEIIAGRCFLCHGMTGESSTELYPRLAGQHPRYLEKQLKDFRAGRRIGGSMEKMAADLNDADIVGLAAFFSMQRSGAVVAADPVLIAPGRTLFLAGNPGAGWPACASCHGEKGAGTENLPRLAGQLPDYLVRQLRNFRNRVRTNDNEVMHAIAERLSETEIQAVSAYLSAQD